MVGEGKGVELQSREGGTQTSLDLNSTVELLSLKGLESCNCSLIPFPATSPPANISLTGIKNTHPNKIRRALCPYFMEEGWAEIHFCETKS